MSGGDLQQWRAANLDEVARRLTQLRGGLEDLFGEPGDAWPPVELGQRGGAESKPLPEGSVASPDLLGARLDLTDAEVDAVLVGLGFEVDPVFTELARRSWSPELTFSLLRVLVPDLPWSSWTPLSSLRYWDVLEVGPGSALAMSPLRLSERILHFMLGNDQLDRRLAGSSELSLPPTTMTESHQAIARQIGEVWARAASSREGPHVQLVGPDAAVKRDIAAAAAATVGCTVWSFNPTDAGLGLPDLERLLSLWRREAALAPIVVLVDLDSAPAPLPALVEPLLRRFEGPLVVSVQERLPVPRRETVVFDIERPTHAEQRELWERGLGEAARGVSDQLDEIAFHFDLSASAIQASCTRALASSADLTEDGGLGRELWSACRVHARPKLGTLVDRIVPTAGWDDLILPEEPLSRLHGVVDQLRHRARVYGHWGFARRGAKGLGVTALFSGASGTGKTLAAEVIAKELELDLYRIDLSTVVDKYIGETEKKLREVFAAAEAGGAVLLFDEADALFGKRSEVKDSRDRHSNIEVSYLLQRVESYRGLAILTTNLKDGIDEAFFRRLRFVVPFPFPDAEQRAAIWSRAFPEETPLDGLDPVRLAQLSVSGGNIRNIALNAAFIAAADGRAVGWDHLHAAAQQEYTKLGRTLTPSETKDWHV